MAKPRVFISSTFYDLKHIRSSLETFVENMGFESVLSEKGNITYIPDVPLDESCYQEAINCDVFVLIIGGRYGSASSDEAKKKERGFFERYESITKREYEAAVKKDIPVYILVDRSVYSEYGTFQKNREKKDIEYAHVDSINIFYLIESILEQPRNNPIYSFEKYSDIESWLREQWAGLFKEMILNRSGKRQLTTLSDQVAELSNVTETLKRYLEVVMSKVGEGESAEAIIATEEERLEENRKFNKLKRNKVFHELETRGFSFDKIKDLFLNSESILDFGKKLNEYDDNDPEIGRMLGYWRSERGKWVIDIVNEGRKIFNLPPLE